MRIGVDATSWTNPRGFGRFTRNAVTRLVDLDGVNTYVLFLDRESTATAELPASAEQRPLALRRPAAPGEASDGTRSPIDLANLSYRASRERLDAFVFPSVFTYFPVFGVPKVVGVHDATASEFPELVLPSRRARTLWAIKQRLAVDTAAGLFTPSESASRSICDHLGVPRRRLRVIPEAPAPVFHPRDEDEQARALAPLGLDAGPGFLLNAGGVNPHKNLERLIDAYALLRHELDGGPRLVIVGALERSYVSAWDRVRCRVAELGLEEHVVFPGFVPDATLACLYSAATAVVIPSLAEGFGLPAVEAAACGTATVLSDLGSHRESLGDAALYAAPTDTHALARQMIRVTTDDRLRARLGAEARASVARLSWDRTASDLRALIEDAVAGG